MKGSNEQTLKEIINELIKTYKLDEGITQARIIGSWEKVSGTLIYKHTDKIYIRKHTLYLKLDSPALKQELSYAKSKIIQKLNKTAGKSHIEDIVFL